MRHLRRWGIANSSHALVTVMVFGVLALLQLVAPVTAAADCLAVNGTGPSGGQCIVSNARTLQGAFSVAEPLVITGTGSINVPTGQTLTLNVTGDVTINSPTGPTGGRISGDVTLPIGIGANIEIQTTGNIVLQANARISAEANTKPKVQADCSVSHGGTVDLDAGGSVSVAKGAVISVSAKCSAGEIDIDAPGDISIEGKVLSQSNLSSVAQARPSGGPITINAGCGLSVKNSALVSSKGRDPGANLVHLQGGCQVEILGLVESTGFGHVVTNPPNRCNLTNRPHNTTITPSACAEVWSGGSITINRTGANKGEINSDTGQSGGSLISWIDLFAAGDIAILGHSSKYAVHANEFLTNGTGGIVTVKSVGGKVTTSGSAIQVRDVAQGGKGGQITVEAGGANPNGGVNLGSAKLQARGATVGYQPAGGTIAARSFNDTVTGAVPGILDATGGLVPSGSVTLKGCGAPAVTYTGASIPAATLQAPQCGSMPTLPAYVTLPSCACSGQPAIGATKTCISAGPVANIYTVTFSGDICNTGNVDVTLTSLLDDQPVANTDIFSSLSATVLSPAQCATYGGMYLTPNNPTTDNVAVEGEGANGSGHVSATATATCDPVGCGNNIVDPGEQCDDGNLNNSDACKNDCTANVCGDGVVNPATEQCDDGNTNNSDGCKNNCTSVCGDGILSPPGEECDDGNTNSNDSCKSNCKPNVCGDGVRDMANEQCDDGNLNPNDACKDDCTRNVCGDGVRFTAVEQCDDGNTNNYDGCKNNCTLGTVVCGDGVVGSGEECDDGNTTSNDGCSATCQTEPRCGDGIVNQGSEQCDDGNSTDTDTCTNACQTARCGDGIVGPGEACDDGNSINTDSCISCQNASCGDGFVQSGVETCDDGNTMSNDGCSATCQTETPTPVCGNGVVETGEQCDDYNTVSDDGCSATCQTEPRCGDGTVNQESEQCDDGNTSNTDACTNACQNARCGDGFTGPGEQCDDGNTMSGDGCPATCQSEPRCGDGTVNQESEQCDDGNTSNTDACTNACHLAVCGDGFVRVGVETCDDSNTESGDGCSATCQTETPAGCGNGTKEGDEECDDGNTTAGDKCSPICKIETGCSIGFWGQHLDVWVAPYTPTGSFVGDVFTIPACLSTCTQPQATDTFLTALTGYSGANNCDNNARNLVRQAVGAVLNVQNPALNYPVAPFSNLVAQVNAALASCNGTTMATLTGTLSTYNVYEYESPTNNVCPGQGNPFP